MIVVSRVSNVTDRRQREKRNKEQNTIKLNYCVFTKLNRFKITFINCKTQYIIKCTERKRTYSLEEKLPSTQHCINLSYDFFIGVKNSIVKNERYIAFPDISHFMTFHK